MRAVFELTLSLRPKAGHSLVAPSTVAVDTRPYLAAPAQGVIGWCVREAGHWAGGGVAFTVAG